LVVGHSMMMTHFFGRPVQDHIISLFALGIDCNKKWPNSFIDENWECVTIFS